MAHTHKTTTAVVFIACEYPSLVCVSLLPLALKFFHSALLTVAMVYMCCSGTLLGLTSDRTSSGHDVRGERNTMV